jgi:hypothetical protein
LLPAGNSQIASQAGKGPELANDQGPVNPESGAEDRDSSKDSQQGIYDQAVQDMHDHRICDASEVPQGRGLPKYAPRRATASTNRRPDQLEMKRAAMPT